MTKNRNDGLSFTHDINNHLNVALGWLEFLLLDNPALKNSSDAMLVKEQLLRAAELSEQFALACRAESESDSDLPRKGFIEICVQDHLDTYTMTAYEKLRKIYDIEINVTQHITDERKYACINPEAATRLRENLVTNAIQAGATRLDVCIEMKEYCVAVSYSDNGKGMSQEDIDKIMLVQHGDGTIHGVGTASIMETIRDHGYHLSYSSTEGVGTVVRVLIPYITM